MFGYGEDAGRLRVFLADGHLFKIPMGQGCLVVEVPRYLPWTGAALALAAVGGWAAWRWLSGRGQETPNLAGPASAVARARNGGTLRSRPPEGASPRVARRSRGASTAGSASSRPSRRPRTTRR